MNRIHSFTLCTLCLVATLARAEIEATLECLLSSQALAPLGSPDHRKYAPDREADVLHVFVDVTPDFKQRTIEGKATLRFKPIATPLRQLKLDAVDLDIQAVTATRPVAAHNVTDEHLIVTFVEPIAPDTEASVTITYRAEPERGLYFRTPEMGYREGDTHLFSQGEPNDARYWIPCFDSPNEHSTTEVICRVPEGMTVISNGRLVSQEKDTATGLVAAHWIQEKPHVNYLITLVAGYFKKIEDRYKDLSLAFYTPPSEFAQASNSYQGTKEMMAFFEEEIGVPYPWAKYDQICVDDFTAGGMENTSATTLNVSTLFTTDTENIRSSENLVAHELAHQWFGDLVTCKDWSHIWLNESFATYYQTLYKGHKHGRDDMNYELYGRARQIMSMSNDVNAIVRRTYDTPWEMFGYLTYPKGGWVLHMLRADLGEDLFRRCIKTYLDRHQYSSVVTEDLRQVIEELSGRPYDQFFDQWLYHARHPELEVSYSWDESQKLAKVSVQQVQKLSENVMLFNFPLAIRFKGDFGTVDRDVRMREPQQDFYFPLASAPRIVRLDPEYHLYAKISFQLPDQMIYAQLEDKEDMIGRLLAIEQLAAKRNRQSVARLKVVLNEDPFHGARIEASRALRLIHSDEALDALLASTRQSDARARRHVVSDIGQFYRDTAHDAALKVLENEANPEIAGEALRILGAYSKDEVRETLVKYLNSDSYRNDLADAAIGAMRLQDDPGYIEPLLETLRQREPRFTSRGLGQAFGTLAYLARNEDNKDSVREYLVSQVNHKKANVQLASINALGTLGDPKAIAVLETFANASRETRERAAAARAITELRSGRRPVDDFRNLRQEVLDLQKANRELKSDFDELKAKFEARGASPEAAKPRPRLQSPRTRRVD